MKKDERLVLFVNNMRDSIHNIDLNIPKNVEIVTKSLVSFLEQHEKVMLEAYDDATLGKDGKGKPIRQISEEGGKVKGNPTIGIGFNMNRAGAKKEWDDAFGGKVSFDDAKKGKIKLTDDQSRALLNKYRG
jgi:hypothetical protein